MSDGPTRCSAFDDWLLDAATSLPDEWADHVRGCDGCRSQWEAHQALAMAFSSKAVPELTPRFDQRLVRTLEADRPASQPLRG